MLPFPSAMIAQQLTGGFEGSTWPTLLAAWHDRAAFAYLARHPSLPSTRRRRVARDCRCSGRADGAALVLSFFVESGALGRCRCFIPSQASAAASV